MISLNINIKRAFSSLFSMHMNQGFHNICNGPILVMNILSVLNWLIKILGTILYLIKKIIGNYVVFSFKGENVNDWRTFFFLFF